MPFECVKNTKEALFHVNNSRTSYQLREIWTEGFSWNRFLASFHLVIWWTKSNCQFWKCTSFMKKALSKMEGTDFVESYRWTIWCLNLFSFLLENRNSAVKCGRKSLKHKSSVRFSFIFILHLKTRWQKKCEVYSLFWGSFSFDDQHVVTTTMTTTTEKEKK